VILLPRDASILNLQLLEIFQISKFFTSLDYRTEEAVFDDLAGGVNCLDLLLHLEAVLPLARLLLLQAEQVHLPPPLLQVLHHHLVEPETLLLIAATLLLQRTRLQ
jgi:hypothetical protein